MLESVCRNVRESNRCIDRLNPQAKADNIPTPNPTRVINGILRHQLHAECTIALKLP